MKKDYFYNDCFYANQKLITIHRDRIVKGLDEPYVISYQRNLIQAMKDLTPSAFKVYICFLMNKDGYKLEFSPANLSKSIRISKDTARSAFKQMIEKGYLVLEKDYKFDFYEVARIPKEQKETRREDNSILAQTLEEKYIRRKASFNLEEWLED